MLIEFEQPINELNNRIKELEDRRQGGGEEVVEELKKLHAQYDDIVEKAYSTRTAWQRVQLARHPRRPYLRDYIHRLFDDFMELHGDRLYADDAAILGGMAYFHRVPVMVIGHHKGRTLQESMEQNFGMPHPEGYRKALRLMKLAEQFKMPIFTFIDTSGAYPGIGAEERGQAEAIARNLREMTLIEVPIIVTVLGEGGSGGALAIGVGDAVLMMENAWYSVISPEGCAAILFRDAAKAEVAAESLKLTAKDLKKFGVVDHIIPEPIGGAQRDPDRAADSLRLLLFKKLRSLTGLSTEKLLRNRFEKFRKLGSWSSRSPSPSRPKKKGRSSKK